MYKFSIDLSLPQDLVRVVLKGRLSPQELPYHLSYALRIVLTKSVVSKNKFEEKWLHPRMTMEQIQQSYGPIDDLK